MSWTPEFWIKEKDFISLKKELLNGIDENYPYRLFAVKIGNQKGIIITEPEFTALAKIIHKIIEKIPHWILNGECAADNCSNCRTWGQQIESEFDFINYEEE